MAKQPTTRKSVAAKAGSVKPARKPATKPASDSANDVVNVLKEDNRKITALFAKYETASDEDKAEVIKDLASALIILSTLREEVIYPALEGAGVPVALLDAAQVSHDMAKLLVEELTPRAADVRYRDAKVAMLAQQFRNQVATEGQAGEGLLAKAGAVGINNQDVATRLKERRT